MIVRIMNINGANDFDFTDKQLAEYTMLASYSRHGSRFQGLRWAKENCKHLGSAETAKSKIHGLSFDEIIEKENAK